MSGNKPPGFRRTGNRTFHPDESLDGVERNRVFASIQMDFFNRLAVDEMAQIVSSPEGEDPRILTRWEAKIKGHYNKALNVSVDVKEDPRVRAIGIRDGVILVNPERIGAVENEDFVLMHEAVHEKQRVLLGFESTEAMINAFTHDMTTSEVGARDWVDRYSMPPFVLTETERKDIFAYFNDEERRKSLARGIRDIHSDTMALSHAQSIYLTEQEREEGIDPRTKFLSQFKKELGMNVPKEEPSVYSLPEPDFIRKVARFKADAQGASAILQDGYAQIGTRYDEYMVNHFGETSSQYKAYTALSTAYTQYFTNCAQRTDLIETDRMIRGLNSENPMMRVRCADFLGEVQSANAISALRQRNESEEHPLVKGFLSHALAEAVVFNTSDPGLWDLVEKKTGDRDLLYSFFQGLHTEGPLPADAPQRLLRIYSKIDFPEVLGSRYKLGSPTLGVQIPGIGNYFDGLGITHPELVLEAAECISPETSKIAAALVWANLEQVFEKEPERCLHYTKKISADTENPFQIDTGENSSVSLHDSSGTFGKVVGLFDEHLGDVVDVIGNFAQNRNRGVQKQAFNALRALRDRYPKSLDIQVKGWLCTERVDVSPTTDDFIEILKKEPGREEEIFGYFQQGIAAENAFLALSVMGAYEKMLEDKEMGPKYFQRISISFDAMTVRDVGRSKSQEVQLLGALAEHDDKYIPRLRQIMADDNENLSRIAGIEMLGLYETRPHLLDDIKGMVHHPQNMARMLFASCLYRLPEHPPEIIGMLRELAKDPDEHVRDAVATVSRVESSMDKDREAKAAAKLTDEMVEICVSLADDPSDMVRASVADELPLIARKNRSVIAPTVAKLRAKGGQKTEFNLGYALGRMPNLDEAELGEDLIKLVDSDSFFAANHAASKIKHGAVKGDARLRAYLPELAKNENAVLSFWGVLGMYETGKASSDDLFDSLERVLKAPGMSGLDGSQFDAQKFQIIREIPNFSKLDPRRGLRLSLLSLGEGRDVNRLYALDTLEAVGKQSGVDVTDVLLEMTADPDVHVRSAAMEAVIKRKGKDTQAIARLLDDERPKNDVKNLIRNHLKKTDNQD